MKDATGGQFAHPSFQLGSSKIPIVYPAPIHFFTAGERHAETSGVLQRCAGPHGHGHGEGVALHVRVDQAQGAGGKREPGQAAPLPPRRKHRSRFARRLRVQQTPPEAGRLAAWRCTHTLYSAVYAATAHIHAGAELEPAKGDSDVKR